MTNTVEPSVASISLDSLLPVENEIFLINAQTAPGAIFADQLDRWTNGAPIIVTQAKREVSNGVVTVVGVTNAFHAFNLGVVATARIAEEKPIVEIRFNLIRGEPLPTSWKFSQTLSLPPFLGELSEEELFYVDPDVASMLDNFRFSDAAFVWTTEEVGKDSITGVPLQAGCNFVAKYMPTPFTGGSLGLMPSIPISGPIVVPKKEELGVILQTLRPWTFPWQLSEQVPGVLLEADLGLNVSVGGVLRLHDIYFHFYAPIGRQWADANRSYMPVTAATALVDIPSAKLALSLTALWTSPLESLSLFGQFEGINLGRLEDLADLVGGQNLVATLPSDLQKVLAQISLDSISLNIGPSFQLGSTTFTVGLPDIPESVLGNLIPGFFLDHLNASFSMYNGTLSTTLGGTIHFLGVAFDTILSLPGGMAWARMSEPTTFPIKQIAAIFSLPMPDVPDLVIDSLELTIGADRSQSVFFLIAPAPGWNLDLGPTTLTIKNLCGLLESSPGRPSTGGMSGTISLGDSLRFDVRYQMAGDFFLQGFLPDVRLSELIDLLTNESIPFPSEFDLAISDASILVQKIGFNFVFQLVATIEHVGSVAFEVSSTKAGQWGFATGIDLLNPMFSSLPGLGDLRPFEQIFTLSELAIIVSTFDYPKFVFPNSSTGTSAKVGSYGSSAIAGFNIYGRWTLDDSKEQRLLKDLLHLSGTLGFALQVALKPNDGSRLFVEYLGAINGWALNAQFGGMLTPAGLSLFLKGQMTIPIQGRDNIFDVELRFVQNGALLSGSMRGTIEFDNIQLSNLALVVGTNWEAIPSFGIAATLTVQTFNSSLAIFFDSTNPNRSLLAGALSELSLKDVVDTFANTAIPASIDDVFAKIALVGTKEFIIDAALSSALDGLQLDLVSSAFQKNGIEIPSDASQTLLIVAESNEKWFLTSMTDMIHYELARTDRGIRVVLQPQFYCAPQDTSIGALMFRQGIVLSSGLDIFSFRARATILVAPNKGILISGYMSPIVIGRESLFSITSASDSKEGPKISASTLYQPNEPDPYKEPHILLDGALQLLGLKISSVYVSVTIHGLVFAVEGQYLVIGYSLKGSFDSSGLQAGGALLVGVGTLDIPYFGEVNIGTGVNGSLAVSVDESGMAAQFTGGFSFAGESFQLSPVSLDVASDSLTDLPEVLSKLVLEKLKKYFEDLPAEWIRQLREGLIDGVSQASQEVIIVLRDGCRLGQDAAAAILHGAGYSATEISQALQSGYNLGPEAVGAILYSLQYSANEIAGALNTTFNLTADTLNTILRTVGVPTDEVNQILQNIFPGIPGIPGIPNIPTPPPIPVDPTKW